MTINIWSRGLTRSLESDRPWTEGVIQQEYESVDQALDRLSEAITNSIPALTEAQQNWLAYIATPAFRDYCRATLRSGDPVSLTLPPPEDEPSNLAYTDECADPFNVWYLVDEGQTAGWWKPSDQLCGLDSPKYKRHT